MKLLKAQGRKAIVIAAVFIAGSALGDGLIMPPRSSHHMIRPGGLQLTNNKLTLHSEAQRKSTSFLLNREDLSFDQKLWTFLIEARPELAFFSERIRVGIEKKWSIAEADHYRYRIFVDDVPVHAATITAHFLKQKFRGVTMAVPEFKSIKNYPAEAIQLQLAEEADGKKASYVAIDGELRVALSYIKRDEYRHYEEVWEDATSGVEIETRPAGFHLIQGRVQAENSRDSETDLVELEHLIDRNSLTGRYFAVETEHELGRVSSTNGVFDFQPFDQARFDQVAAYHNLSVGLDWFKKNFDYHYELSEPIKVVIDSQLDGSPNNAQYIPKGELDQVPMLVFGAGTKGKFEHLARDKDVAMHELAHHIIFRYIDDARGHAGALHEGFADYFTYALMGDPFLAEQVVPDAPYIRSALLGQDKTYDNALLQRNAHTLGQIWSAFLWETRESIGEEFDQTVYHALSYLNAGSQFGDAIEALLLADLETHPNFQVADDASPSTGPFKCQILNAAVDRGYASYLTHLEGKTCGLDLEALAAASELKKESEYDDGPLIFKACGQIANLNPLTSLMLLLSSLFFPLILPLLRRKER